MIQRMNLVLKTKEISDISSNQTNTAYSYMRWENIRSRPNLQII